MRQVLSARRERQSAYASYVGRVSQRTLWEEGTRPGAQIVILACGALALAVLVDVTLTQRLSWFFDVCFVVVCLAAALGIRPGDFFVAGVLPPLLLFAVVLLVALLTRSAIADPVDGPVQAVVSGLAHHATALVVAYVLTVLVLILRQAFLRSGTLSPKQRRRSALQPSGHAGARAATRRSASPQRPARP